MGSKNKKKFYVVWSGKKPGVYESWSDCQSSISGFSGAKFKSFATLEAAQAALQSGPSDHWGVNTKPASVLSPEQLKKIGMPVVESLSVDAAWNAESKVMEYQGVWTENKELVFHQGPFEKGTNNIGEFLAIVHGLAMLQRKGLASMPIYSDSATALSWVRKKKCNSKSVKLGQISAQINDLIQRAETWLQSNTWENKILKWETKAWGEIPADFGRKK